jgi:AraC-like DNA-binding protein
VATAEHFATAALDTSPSPGGRSPHAATAAEAVAAKLEALLVSPGSAALSADTVAAELHMSARTLHRRLEAEGTRFGEVLDRVRERRARRLLEDPAMPLAEIAYRSGFADLATFSRAFKRWTGIAPGAFRRSKATR